MDSTLAVRIRMYIESVKRQIDNEGKISYEVTAQEVEQEGQLSFTIHRPEMLNKLLPGQNFFVDLTPTTEYKKEG